MAYTIVKSDGTILTTIADGTINTTSTSIGLPGRNYAGYGQILDTNFVHQLENFASSTPPANPVRGQLWYNTNTSTLYVCPTDGETNPASWSSLAATSTGGSTTFGEVNVTGNLYANNVIANNDITGNSITVSYATVTANASIANASINLANIDTLYTQLISTGSAGTSGDIIGTWTMTGGGTANGISGTSLWVTQGNLMVTGGSGVGVKSDNYYYANGIPISFAGTYSNSNVASYLPAYNGVLVASNVNTTIVTTGSNTTPGALTGTWTLNGGGMANGINGTSLWVTQGNIVVTGGTGVGIKTDNYYYANGAAISFAGTYSNSNVATYLPTYNGTLTANALNTSFATVSTSANIVSANVTNANVTTLRTQNVTTGSGTTTGVATGTWTVSGGGTANGVSGTSLWVTQGNIVVSGAGGVGIKTDNYYYANGVAISFTGSYSNSNVASYLPTYNGVILASNVTTPILTTGANNIAGTITGNWTLSAGSKLTSTYADLAERFESDIEYDAGTVVELGGDKEITAVKYELSDDVFGVISNSAGYVMNGLAGDDITHPAVAVGGRVKVKVYGRVKKGQRLVSAGDGKARAAQPGEATAFNIIGRSLENKTTDGVGVVEAFVKIN